MKKYNKETIKDINSRNPLVKFGNLNNEIYTWFYVERNSDGSLVGNPPIRVRVIGKSFPNPHYWITRDKSPHYVLEYVCDGIGHIVCDGNEYTVNKGDVYLLEPGSNHKYYSDKKNPYTKIWINFESDIFEKLIKDLNINGIVKFPNVFCEDLFEELLRIEDKSLFHNVIAYDTLEILFKIALRLFKSINNPEPYIPEQINNIKLMLDQSFFGNLTIEDICEQHYLSRSYVISNFKKYFGVTPHKYLIDGKIKISISLLRNYNKSIKEIATELGFYDVYHFSKTFKQKLGVSPSEYRAIMKRKSSE